MSQDLDSQPWLHPQDLLGDRLARLQALVPEAFVEGVLDFERLRSALGGSASEAPAAFGLSWAGKESAMRLAFGPAVGTLSPDRGASVGFDAARHVVVEGDNLEVLKLLQRGYHDQVKLIVIDPPYNTGKTFIYDDDYREGVQAYLASSGQLGLVSNPERAGRFHSRWLSMMAPRLVLARQLLREDGFLVVAIDDHEVHHLRLLLDEVFGAENFIANVVWQKKYTRSNDARFFSDTHDHLLVYARHRASARLNLLPRDAAQTRAYANPDADPRGPWKATPLHAKSGRGQGFRYTFANGVVWSPPPGTFPRFSAETLATLEANGEIWFGADGTAVPARKSYLGAVKDGVTPVTLWPHGEVGHAHEANEELKALLGECVFDNPKPTRLVRRFLELMTSPTGEDLVLDFFAGSGTTGHAVLLQNAEDGGNRRFILVQLPEPTGRQDYPTIADVTRARISKALRALKPCSAVSPSAAIAAGPPRKGDIKVGESPAAPGTPPGDNFTSPFRGGPASVQDAEGETAEQGYRAFRLAPSCFTPWSPSPDNLEAQLRAQVSPLLPDRTDEDVVFELLLKAGLPLTTPVETLASKTYRAGHLLINLQPTLTEADLLAHRDQPQIVLDSALTDALKTFARLHHLPLTTV